MKLHTQKTRIVAIATALLLPSSTFAQDLSLCGPGVGLPLGPFLKAGDHILSSNSGNVGIGVEDPSSKLHVGGTVRATQYLIEDTPLAQLFLSNAEGAVRSNNIQNGSLTEQDVNPSRIQLRVSGICAEGQFLSSIAESGAVSCASPLASGGEGDVTAVRTTTPLTGGGESGDLNLGIDMSALSIDSSNIIDGAIGLADINTLEVQRRLSGNCAVGHYVRGISSSGTLECAAESTGDIGSITTLSPLNGGGTSGDITLGLDLLALYTPLDQRYLNIGESIPGSAIQPNSITTTQILDGTITGSDLAPGTLTGTHLADSSIGSNKIANGSLASIDIADRSLGAQDIALSSLTGAEIADSSITPSKLSFAAQQRVTGQCSQAEYMKRVNGDGSVHCSAPKVQLGTLAVPTLSLVPASPGDPIPDLGQVPAGSTWINNTGSAVLARVPFHMWCENGWIGGRIVVYSPGGSSRIEEYVYSNGTGTNDLRVPVSFLLKPDELFVVQKMHSADIARCGGNYVNPRIAAQPLTIND